MDLRNLKTFISVAELASFTRAAEQLGFSQSTVSFQIKQLERELGIRLFERTRHAMKLTDQGREVLRYAYRMDKLTQDLAEDLHAKEDHQSCATGYGRLAVQLPGTSLPGILVPVSGHQSENRHRRDRISFPALAAQ